MNSVKKLQLNTIVSLLNRLVIMVSGLILPRMIISAYGSETNGLVSSVTQFLGIITFLDLGVGSVVQSALYKPLALQDNKSISRILAAAKSYFRKIAFILIIYILLLIVLIPTIIDNESLDILSTIFLIIAISISQFARYYFGIVNEFLLNADQKEYIQLTAEIVVVVLNLIASIFLIQRGYPIYTVKLVSSILFLIRPIFLYYYVKKNYNLNLNIKLNDDPLPQKWSGVGQHIAYSIQSSTDITVLTVFSSLTDVSIYSVYNLVTNAIKLLISSFTTSLQSFFGNLLSNDSIGVLNSFFGKIEWIVHTIVIFLYSMTAVLISSFAVLYAGGVDDVNYYQPIFAIFLVLSSIMFSLRTPYQALVFAAGHFKQTQMSSFVEAGLNILLSVIFVIKFGLIGVALGSFIALLFRVFYLANYLSKNIINRPTKYFFKQILVDLFTLILILCFGNFILSFTIISNFFDWFVIAVLIGIISLIIILLVNFFCYKKLVFEVVSRFVHGKK